MKGVVGLVALAVALVILTMGGRVRALPARQAVILKRSTAEYIALGVLCLLELARSDLESHADRINSSLSLLVTALVAVALAEAVARIVSNPHALPAGSRVEWPARCVQLVGLREADGAARAVTRPCDDAARAAGHRGTGRVARGCR